MEGCCQKEKDFISTKRAVSGSPAALALGTGKGDSVPSGPQGPRALCRPPEGLAAGLSSGPSFPSGRARGLEELRGGRPVWEAYHCRSASTCSRAKFTACTTRTCVVCCI